MSALQKLLFPSIFAIQESIVRTLPEVILYAPFAFSFLGVYQGHRCCPILNKLSKSDCACDSILVLGAFDLPDRCLQQDVVDSMEELYGFINEADATIEIKVGKEGDAGEEE